MKKLLLVLVLLLGLGLLTGCGVSTPSVDTQQKQQTQELQQQAQSKLGMPNIVNFYEKETMKTIMEQCDKANLITYAYSRNDMSGKFVYIGQCMGYGLPYGTQYTNPMYTKSSYQGGYEILPQVDPNGLYKPSDVDATWLMLIDPADGKAKPIYFESELTVVPFKLSKNLLESFSIPINY